MKIGLFGRNSTHFLAYGKVLTGLGNDCLYVEEKNPIESNLKQYKNFYKVNSEEISKNCDLVLLTHRFANEHLPELKRLINNLNYNSKIFVDKPIVDSLFDIEEILKIEKTYNTGNITSFSPLRFCDELKEIKDISIQNKNNSIDINIFAPIAAEDIGNDERFKSPLFYGVHAIEMGLEISKVIFEHKVEISTKSYKNSKEINFKNQNKSIEVSLKPSAYEFYKVEMLIDEKIIFEKNITLDGSYYLNCAELLMKFHEKGLDEAKLPNVKEACEGISLLLK